MNHSTFRNSAGTPLQRIGLQLVTSHWYNESLLKWTVNSVVDQRLPEIDRKMTSDSTVMCLSICDGDQVSY